MTLQDELQLLQKAQSGDREALGQLWDALSPKLYGYLVNVTKNRELAEDLLQTTWLKASQALPRFNSRGSGLSPWLFAIARNECNQHWRKANREVAFDEATHDRAVDNRGQTENKLVVEQLLNLLSEDDRELLRLRYIADLSLKDVAAVLNINAVAVRVRMHRALSRARVAMKSQTL